MVPSIPKKFSPGDKRSVSLEPDTMAAKGDEKALWGHHNNKNIQPSGKLGGENTL